MKFLKYWAVAESVIESPVHGTVCLRKWGGSDRSTEEAQGLAKKALAELVARIRERGTGELGGHYEYGECLREELLEESPHDDAKEPLYAISRNRYGALVLNAPGVLFADIDGTRWKSPLETLKRLFGWKPKHARIGAIKRHFLEGA